MRKTIRPVNLGKAGRCTVCGVRVTEIGPLASGLCDSLCARARKAGRGRDEQRRQEEIDKDRKVLWKKKAPRFDATL
jgi:hypothetical protein